MSKNPNIEDIINQPQELIFPSDIKKIKNISEEFVQKLEARHVDPSIIFDIKLCLEEAVRNAIEHGNKYDKSKKVTIRYNITDEYIKVTIIDEGEGFAPSKVPSPIEPENLLKEGGRGVFLIHRMMDQVTYNDVGNQVEMTKFFNNPKNYEA